MVGRLVVTDAFVANFSRPPPMFFFCFFKYVCFVYALFRGIESPHPLYIHPFSSAVTLVYRPSLDIHGGPDS